jgi:putative peptidoglycan lipid II flippase
MPGLFFIALNRILAPAFYAQSDSKSPTLAGLISFAANICLAVALVRPLRGAGIALALSLSSAVNTFLLFVFLRRKPHIVLGRALVSAMLYVLRLALLSGIAIIPVRLLSPRLLKLFAGRGRFISYGGPLAINALIFAALGIMLLAITKDSQLRALKGMLLRKTSGRDSID